MKAIVLTGSDGALHLENYPDPEPARGEAVVALKAAALNHRDLWIQKGQYAGIKYPTILGSDGVGTVIECGDGVNKKWLKREVIINPGFDWGKNPAAQGKDFKILGLPQPGTFAERIVVPVTQLVDRPKHLSVVQAAALPLAGLTAYRSLFTRARVKKGENVLITGVGGGVALIALQFAVAAGAHVYVTSGSAEKIRRAIKMGAQDGVLYRNADWVQQLEKMAGSFPVIIDSAGGVGFSGLIDLASSGGRIAFFGATHGNPTDFNMRKVFWKQLNILGTTMGTPAEFDAMVKFVLKNKITPLVHSTFPLAKATEALAVMDSSEQFGKLVLTIQP